jgi:hypothetical protein
MRISALALAGLAAVGLLASGSPLPAQAVRSGTLPAPLPLFPPDNWWNVNVSAAPLDTNSAVYISFIGTTRALHPDFGGDEDPTDPNNTKAPRDPLSGILPTVPATAGSDASRLGLETSGVELENAWISNFMDTERTTVLTEEFP